MFWVKTILPPIQNNFDLHPVKADWQEQVLLFHVSVTRTWHNNVVPQNPCLFTFCSMHYMVDFNVKNSFKTFTNRKGFKRVWKQYRPNCKYWILVVSKKIISSKICPFEIFKVTNYRKRMKPFFKSQMSYLNDIPLRVRKFVLIYFAPCF